MKRTLQNGCSWHPDGRYYLVDSSKSGVLSLQWKTRGTSCTLVDISNFPPRFLIVYAVG